MAGGLKWEAAAPPGPPADLLEDDYYEEKVRLGRPGRNNDRRTTTNSQF